MKRFTWFNLQSKLATEIAWRLEHQNSGK